MSCIRLIQRLSENRLKHKQKVLTCGRLLHSVNDITMITKYFSCLDQQEVAVIKCKVKTIAFYSLLALRREHKNEDSVLVSVTKNEDI